MIHQVDSATTDCQPNENVEALRVFMLSKKIEARPTWKPMHKQPVYAGAPLYTNGIEEELFKVGFCLPAGPYVTDDDVNYIVSCINQAILPPPLHHLSLGPGPTDRFLLAISAHPPLASVGSSTTSSPSLTPSV